jgi:Leucine-rich repeat (LRR) protein
MRHNQVTDEGIRELAGMNQLEELHVQGTKITNVGAAFIAENLKQLKKLDFGNTKLGDAGLRALAGMPNLRELTIYGTSVTDKGLASLPKLKTLEELRIGGSGSDEGMKSIARCDNLRVLYISNCHVSDKGFRELWNLPQLQELEIHNGPFGTVTNQAVDEFKKTHPTCKMKGP